MADRRNRTQPYPCCHFIHGFVDCALHLRDQVVLDEIESIDCPLSPRLHHMVSGPSRPADPYSALFSTPYVVALALVTGRIDLAAFHDRGVNDSAVLALSDRITCSEDRTSDFPVHFPGEVRITLKSGRVVTHRVATSFGTPERPLSTSDIKAKFMANATRVMSRSEAERVVQSVSEIESMENISELLEVCRISSAAS